MRNTLAKRDPVAITRQHDTPAATVHQLELATDVHSEGQEAALETMTTLNADEPDTLTNRDLAEGEHVGHGTHINDNDSQQLEGYYDDPVYK